MSSWRASPPSGLRLAVLGVVLVAILVAVPEVRAPLPPQAVAPASGAHGLVPSVDTTTTLGEWADLTTVSGAVPEPRQGYAMDYDPALNAIILFGGADTNGNPLGDTWEYTQRGWTNLTPSLTVSPAPRGEPAMTYDPALGGLLLFGGKFATGPLNAYDDTWEFNASGWTQLSPATSPPEEAGELMDYDAANGYVFLWGTAGSSGTLNEWTFENGDWTNITSTVTGAPSSLPVYGTYDPQMNYILYYGDSAACGTDEVTYSYSDGQFHDLTSTELTSPSPVVGSGAMTYDPAAEGVILFSGYNSACALTDYTWEFQNGQWANLTSFIGTPAPGRWDARLAYDPSLGGAVTFSGNENPFGGENDFGGDTWAYRVPLGVNATVTPNAGEAPLHITFNATAAAGAPPYSFRWTFDDGTSAALVANGTHVFTVVGNYTVTLSVTDALGDVDTVSFSVPVTGVPVPTHLAVDASITPGEGVAPFAVVFNATVTGGETPYTVRWDFGDGTPAVTTANGTHTFEQVGTYTATLSVEDAVGSFVNSSFRVVVTEPPVKTPVTSGLTDVALGLAIGLVVGAVAAGGIVWAVSRRRTPPNPPPPSSTP